MKPILSHKVTRGELLNEWEPAAHQSTMDGLREFEQRQRERMKQAQAAAAEAKVKVRKIK